MQRKQAETDDLRRKIASLEDAIEGLSNEFLGFGERVVTSSQVPARPQVLDDLRRTTERVLSIARVAEAVAGNEEGAGTGTGKSTSSSPIVESKRKGHELRKSPGSSSPKAQSCLPAEMGVPMSVKFTTRSPPAASAGTQMGL